MKFCPDCGSIMKFDKKEGYSCSCGYHDTTKAPASGVIKEQVISKTTTIVVDAPKIETLPLTDATCPKCNHNKARWWLLQTRSSDEPETQFFKCDSCAYTWRDYR